MFERCKTLFSYLIHSRSMFLSRSLLYGIEIPDFRFKDSVADGCAGITDATASCMSLIARCYSSLVPYVIGF